MRMKSEVGGGKEQEDLQFAYIMYDDEIQSSICAVCPGTETEATAFIGKIHSGDKIHVGKMVCSVIVNFHIHIAGLKRKQKFDRSIGVDKLPQMQPIQPFFYGRMGYLVADGSVVTDSTADGKAGGTIFYLQDTSVQRVWNRWKSVMEQVAQSFYGIGRQL